MYKYKYKYRSKYAPHVQEMITKEGKAASQRDLIGTRQFPYQFSFENKSLYTVKISIDYTLTTGKTGKRDLGLGPYSTPQAICNLPAGIVYPLIIHSQYWDPSGTALIGYLADQKPTTTPVCYVFQATGVFPNIYLEIYPRTENCNPCK
jgi:hypothetical protein